MVQYSTMVLPSCCVCYVRKLITLHYSYDCKSRIPPSLLWVMLVIRQEQGHNMHHVKMTDTDFPLTLAHWPMASEHCRWTSDFLSYWPRLPSGISTIAKNFKKRKTKLFSWKNLQISKNLKKKVMWPSIEPITDPNSLWNLIFDETFLFVPFHLKSMPLKNSAKIENT